MMNEIESIINFIIGVQAFIVIAFIAQFISNMVIIFQLPKIKRACEAICYEEDDDEEVQNS